MISISLLSKFQCERSTCRREVLCLNADFKHVATLWEFVEAIVVGKVDPMLLNEKSKICKELVFPNDLQISRHPEGRNLFQCKNNTFNVELWAISFAIAGALMSVRLFLLRFRYFKDVSVRSDFHSFIMGLSPILLPSKISC